MQKGKTGNHDNGAALKIPPGTGKTALLGKGFPSQFSPCLAVFSPISYLVFMKYPFHPSLEFLGTAAQLPKVPRGLPLYLSPVEAGFPSPSDDSVDRRLDLHEHLVRNEAATFFLRAHGESMLGAGIHDGDLLIVDRSIEAGHNRIVIAALDGELTVKRLVRRHGRVLLAPENPNYPEFDITEREYVHIWGVVTYVIHKL